ncbi:unnamed protein product [Soboliphyme baturini]|uniref:Uncharacterized protein n=1 Tax=Soboliphyme baturini TaxID=241478 RepID=A0A183IVN6_9BILA|nr:unnamed protein product [Soboliphyme baturini]
MSSTSPGGTRAFHGANNAAASSQSLDIYQGGGAPDMTTYLQPGSPQPLHQLHMKVACAHVHDVNHCRQYFKAAPLLTAAYNGYQ